MDTCSYSHLGGQALHPPQERGICGNKLRKQEQKDNGCSGSSRAPTSKKSSLVKKRYLVIGRDYLAREYPDAEYKYRGVFVAAINHQATEKRRYQSLHVNHLQFYPFYISTLIFVSLDVFSALPTTGLSIFACS